MATDKIQTGIRFHEEMLKKITYIAKRTTVPSTPSSSI